MHPGERRTRDRRYIKSPGCGTAQEASADEHSEGSGVFGEVFLGDELEGLDDLLGDREHTSRALNDDYAFLSDLECDGLERSAVAGRLRFIYGEWLGGLWDDELDVENDSADCDFVMDALKAM